MKSIKNFKIGSRCFFECFDDFVSKDIDELHIMDKPLFGKNISFLVKSRDKGKDYILYPPFSKDEFIEYDLKTNDAMKFGKYLCPEFINYICLSIDDLKKFEKLVKKLDKKHQYQKIIYDSYIKNNSFSLNDEQLKSAYGEYKRSRGN